MNNIIDHNNFPHLLAGNINCQTYDTDYLKRNLVNIRSGHNFSIVHQNIRSFGHNVNEFNVLIDNLKFYPEILVLTETWFSTGTCTEILGYEGYHVHRGGRRCRGVSVFVKSGIQSYAVEEHTYVTNELELNSVELTVGSRLTVQIIGVYRPPRSKYHCF